ncbi:MAG TPA: aminotransferase class V-fold PLP-dependent enzyme, partial [Terriglobia bacterium]|nr:aminotransferase class V-fold PLP-dependent enzyme [Terriglobia bacterium]
MTTLKHPFSRRNFLAAGSSALTALRGFAAPPGPRHPAGPAAAESLSAAAKAAAAPSQAPGGAAAPHIYDRLGVRTRINAKGTYTYLSGSLVSPEVTQAMDQAAQHFVVLEELQRAVGARIAAMLGVEAACVTSGAAGAMTLGTAACVAGSDPEKIKRLPDLAGMKSEVVIQKSHRNAFDHAIRNVGVKLVVIETADELEHAINPNTAMLHFSNFAQNQGKISLAQWVEAGKRHNVPTFNDAAADVPPLSHLTDYVKMGFDLVAFSGGKGLRGPQCAGLMLGRKDLIEAALLNNNPNEDSVGRPLKVGKEEIAGMYAAIERYLKIDHDAEWKDWEARLDVVDRAVSAVPGVHTSRFVPDVANHVPHLYVEWDEKALGLTLKDCLKQLEDGEPSVVCLGGDGERPRGLG